MFGVSWAEMLVVLLVAVVVVGPRDMPRVLYTAGKTFRKFKAFTSDIQSSLDRVMAEEELEEITRDANRAGGDNLQFEIDRQYAAEQAAKEKEAENGEA